MGLIWRRRRGEGEKGGGSLIPSWKNIHLVTLGSFLNTHIPSLNMPLASPVMKVVLPHVVDVASINILIKYTHLASFPGLRPDFISQPCEIKSGRRPGNEATHTLSTSHATPQCQENCPMSPDRFSVISSWARDYRREGEKRGKEREEESRVEREEERNCHRLFHSTLMISHHAGALSSQRHNAIRIHCRALCGLETRRSERRNTEGERRGGGMEGEKRQDGGWKRS